MRQILLLLFFGIFINSSVLTQTIEASTCSTANSITVGADCNPVSFNLAANQDHYWIQFTATKSTADFITNIEDLLPTFSSISLFSGNCGALQLELIDSSFLIGDTLNLVNLNIGQTYFIDLTVSSDFESKFGGCVINKNFITGYFYFTDQDGNVITCSFNSISTTIVDSIYGYIHNCPELTFCITDTICITMDAYIDDGTLSTIADFDFVFAFGLPFASITYNSDYSEACMTFNNTGNTIAYLDPGHDGVSQPYTNVYTYNTVAEQWLWHGDIESYISINVIDSVPPAVSNNGSDILCLGSTYTLEAYPGSILTSVTVNNTTTVYPDSAFWSTTFSTAGDYIISYTEEGLCNPATYVDTIYVIDSTELNVTIDACNFATFTFTTCELFPTVTLAYGDGNLEVLNSFTGTVTWTHDYSSITGPITWLIEGQQQLIGFPPGTMGVTFSQTGTVNPSVPQPLTISSPTYLCEMGTGDISIISPTSLSSIFWSSQPTIGINGQGTASVTLQTIPTNSDVYLYVTAIDSSGCKYADTVSILACCSPIITGTEFFERNYTQLGLNSMANQLPAGYYNGPTSQVSINLPVQPALSNQYATSFSAPTNISLFITANPSILMGGNISTQNWIFINNDLIIDIPVNFVNCPFVRIAPGARIILNPNIVFTSSRSTFAPKCDEMWGGFYLSDPTQQINLADVNIIGAIHGIESTKGGIYHITNSRFVDNLHGIYVHDYPIVNTLSTVANSYFGDVTGQNLLFPHQTEPQPLTGILIQDIKEITIGLTTVGNGNLFHNHQKGIDAFRSSVRSYKNNFYNIRHAAGVPVTSTGDKFCAIYAVNAFAIIGGLANHTVWIGDLASNRNNFLNCEVGISSKKSMNLEAHYNYMKNCSLRGISAEDNRLKTMNIYYNEINSTNSNAWGIFVKNYANGTANIFYNQINTNTFSFSSITRFAAGIYVSSVTPTAIQTTSISYNTVQNCLYGIWMLNITNGLINNNTVNINFSNAVINNLSANFAPIRGILVQNSTKAKIFQNQITRNMGSGNGVINDNLQGIRLELSPASEVWFNIMTRTAVGFYAKGSSLGSRVDCNQMHYTRNGFYMDWSDLSDQGAPVSLTNLNGYDARNAWYYTFSDRTAGNMSVVNRYYHGTNTDYYSNPITILTSQWVDIPLLSATPYHTCYLAINPPLVIDSVKKRTRELLPIAQNSIQYGNLDEKMKHYLKLNAYSRLDNENSLLVMNVPEDTVYLDFMNENNSLNSQTKVLYDIQKTMSQEDYSVALTKLNELDVNSDQYGLNKIVQQIWIESKMNDLELNNSDIAILTDFACLDPIEFGSGVYQARAIIDWDGFCLNQDKSVTIDESVDHDDTPISNIYPNPAKGLISIQSSEIIENAVVLDLKGAELKNNRMNASSFELDLQLSTGVYILKLIYNNGNVETHKLFIE